MAKLHFIYSTMNAGKSLDLLKVEHNYRERDMTCLLLTAAIDDRFGVAKITSRLGLSSDAQVFSSEDNLLEKFLIKAAADKVACVLIDEAQFLTRAQVLQICEAVDNLGLPTMAWGLRTDFRGELFEGSQALMALADELRPMHTVCHCGKRATMVLRKGPDGEPTLEGGQVQVGGNETYVALCRTHWTQSHQNVARRAKA
jgi:thymidine kinase